jgi:hypothetical protein
MHWIDRGSIDLKIDHLRAVPMIDAPQSFQEDSRRQSPVECLTTRWHCNAEQGVYWTDRIDQGSQASSLHRICVTCQQRTNSVQESIGPVERIGRGQPAVT